MKVWNHIYGLDHRSITLFRVTLGAYFIAYFSIYILPNFNNVFSPENGILGNCFAEGYATFYNVPELLFAIRSDILMLVFISIQIVAALLLMVGIYPRLMATALALMLWFFHLRYNVLYLGWDMYISVLLFLSILLPVRRWNEMKREKGIFEWRSPLAFIFLFQIGFIYFYNGISKNGDKWMNGTAVKFLLAETDKARLLSGLAIEWDWLTHTLTYLTLFAEISIIFFLFIPWNSKWFRLMAILLILTLHWGIDLFVDVGFFKWAATCASILLIPGMVWDSIKIKTDKFWEITFPKHFLKISLGRITNTVQLILAVLLLFVIVESNLYHTAISQTTDRIKGFIHSSGSGKIIQKAMPVWFPEYSFFKQYWHFYSPNPPEEKGYMQVEVVTSENDTIRISNGVPLREGVLYSNTPTKHLYQYLTLRRLRNQREKIALKCILMREVKLWNQNKSNKRINKIEAVVYSFRPNLAEEISKETPVYSRLVWESIDINYKK